MKSCLLIVGSTSSILKDYSPAQSYDLTILCDRSTSFDQSSSKIHVHYELLNPNSNDSVLEAIGSGFDTISIIYSSYHSHGLNRRDQYQDSLDSIGPNIVQPLNLFSRLSSANDQAHIRGVFISSMYAHICPYPNNYKSEESQNPLYYGAYKSAVEQGLRWLSVQNSLHSFNMIALGPMPKAAVYNEDPNLINALLNHLPSGTFVKPSELYSTIDFLLNMNQLSIRGVSVPLDGGYSLW